MHSTQPRILKRYEWSLAIGWTLVIATLLYINVLHERSQTVETARTQARSNFQRDVIYRQWNASSGSVYVEVSKEIQPNPYLSHIPDRDVTTATGKRLTLVNPAYMTRLVFDLAAQSQEVRGHISSLRPVRSQNVSDSWESDALRAFTRGETEVSAVQQVAGTSYLRLMGPLVTEQECLKCHGKDGYHLGDIRGGISVAVPMEPLWKIARQNILLYVLSFALLWLTGLAGIFVGASRLRDTIRQRDRAEQEIVDLNRDLLSMTAELETSNQELESFCSTVSHDLRSPLMCISGYCQLLQQLPAERHMEECGEFSGIIFNQARRMDKLIDTLLDFSRVSRGEFARETVDLSGIAEGVAMELQLASPHRSAQFRIAAGVTADGDPELLRVVLQNLLGNALKYTGKREDALIQFGAREEDAKTVYFVRDNGIGFDKEQSGRMFEAFSRLSNSDEFEGNGIGLATVKRIINRHGGRIWCEGELGKGACFYFTL
jgi:signal transduction histidine kinase